ncbi:uncharacterized protein TRAVEDRAFT_21882 [Trametes versicolor FP-101664 SS1]|uniref:uncharacterized protein n=1 Tax=Trametes versicolor (strain FP-101664) TaxID=717944 RepID=UPI0004623ED0|nr:uncharacterized protein TRAVEDRAFT_21882 [Trametes versicolor FP-101664 SS1]EIW56944.1 hypothetical protein TRAVEDRAFT_21882 [Trametes versicolor FP-101664 SS1]
MESTSDDPYELATEHSELTLFVVALFLETLFFGAFTVTYTMGSCSLSTTIASRKHSTRDWVLLGVSTTMFGLAFTHIALTLRLALHLFVGISASLATIDDELYGISIRSALGAPRAGIYVTQILIGDIFMIYRLFLVWNRSLKVIILPTIFCLLGGGLIMWRVVRNADQYTSRSARRNLYRKVVEAILQSITASVALCIILFVNPDIGFIVCTSAFPSLIYVRKVWDGWRGCTISTTSYEPRTIAFVNALLYLLTIQIFNTANHRLLSAAIYSTASVALALTFFLNPHNKPGFLVCLDLFPPLIATGSSNESTNSFKPAKLNLRNSELAEDRDLKGPPREDDLGVLDIRASKSSWNM